MANHAFASCRGVSAAALFAAFREGLRTAALRFPGAWRLEQDEEDAVEVLLLDPQTGKAVARALFWNNGRQIEWRHPIGVDLEWWFQETVASMAASAAAEILDRRVVLTDEGINGRMAPNYHLKYPRYSDWIRAIMDPLGQMQEASLPIAEQVLPVPYAALRDVVETPISR